MDCNKEIFNSNLVQTMSGETEAVASHLVLSRSFWLYPCITLGLMVLTFLPILGLLLHNRLHRLPSKSVIHGKGRS